MHFNTDKQTFWLTTMMMMMLFTTFHISRMEVQLNWAVGRSVLYFGVRFIWYVLVDVYLLLLLLLMKMVLPDIFIRLRPSFSFCSLLTMKQKHSKKMKRSKNRKLPLYWTSECSNYCSCALKLRLHLHTHTWKYSLDLRDIQAKWGLRSPLRQFCTVCFKLLVFYEGKLKMSF